jgi:orotidine-5'-phosphate decarboxylase
LKRETGIILALDVESLDRALEIAEKISAYVDAIKVGYPLVLSEGLKSIGALKNYGKPLIADFKVADIPEISKRICQKAVDAGADYITVHGFVGEDVVEACSEVADIFVVAEMSHPGAEDFMAEDAEKIVKIAKRYAYGIVAPATRPERIRRLRMAAGNLTIISPGVKAQGGKPGDAIRAGADFEIIGRGIYGAEDPLRAVKEFAEAIRRVEPGKK